MSVNFNSPHLPTFDCRDLGFSAIAPEMGFFAASSKFVRQFFLNDDATLMFVYEFAFF